MAANLAELREFVKRAPPRDSGDHAIIEKAQERARALLKQFGGKSGASKPGEKTARIKHR
jgi:hypothetical protein